MMTSGKVMLGMIVAHSLRRKAKITSTTSPTVSAKVNSTSETEARMLAERSATRSTFTARGIDASSCGSIASIWSTTWIVFAPGCSSISSSSQGMVPNQLPVRGLTEELITRPMSFSSTGAPLL